VGERRCQPYSGAGRKPYYSGQCESGYDGIPQPAVPAFVATAFAQQLDAVSVLREIFAVPSISSINLSFLLPCAAAAHRWHYQQLTFSKVHTCFYAG
jgi:hypothetical protein